jgi:hypothetical protein
MSIVGAFDVHRRQLTFEYLDTGSGELERARGDYSTWPSRLIPPRYGARSGAPRPTPGSCIRIWSMSLAAGLSGSPRPCCTKASRLSARWILRPQPPSRGTRSRIMSPQPQHSRSEHRDKPGRPARRGDKNLEKRHPHELTTSHSGPRASFLAVR